MSVDLNSVAQALDQCGAPSCDGKQYKNGYCVEHFVKFGETGASSNGDSSRSSSVSGGNGAAPSSGTGASPSPEPSNAAPVKKVFKFGGGGNPCTVCSKTAYPAETMQFEMKPYHIECFKCNKCTKRLDAPQASLFEGTIYCKMCFQREGLHRKQAEVKWTAGSSNTSSSSVASKFGGGGNPCNKCQKTVYAGETMSFEGKVYHPKCLTCTDCSKECTLNELSQFDGNLYCRRCWDKGAFAAKQRNVSWDANAQAAGERRASAAKPSNPLAAKFGGGGNPCAKCDKTVYAGEAMQFEMKLYHPKCLTCTDCSKECTVNELNQYENKLYCKRCWEKGGFVAKQRDVKWNADGSAASKPTSSVASKFGGGGNPCNKCGLTVYAGETMQFEMKVYHPKCLTCTDCSKECTVNELNQFEGKLYCKRCWEKGNFTAKQRATASGAPSDKPKSAVSAKFASLGGGGNKCYVCTQTVYPAETLQYEGRPYHGKCFKCVNCSKEILQVAQAEHKADKIYCNKCFMELGLWQATLN